MNKPFLEIGLLLVFAIDAHAKLYNKVSFENMCGVIALSCAARASGAEVDVEQVVSQLPLDGQMKSFGDLEKAAQELGLATNVVRWHINQAPKIPAPCIVRFVPKKPGMLPHFVILLAAKPGAVRVFDPPALPPTWISDSELFRNWDGVALYVSSDPAALSSIVSAGPLFNWWLSLGVAVGGASVLLRLAWPLIVATTSSTGKSRRIAGPAALTCMSSVMIIFGVVWIASLGSSAESNFGPYVFVEPTSLELVVSDTTYRETGGWAKGSYVVRNEGDLPVRILRITPNCSCVLANAVSSSDGTIPPRGSIRIDVEIDLRDRPSRGADILVELNGSIPDRLILRLKASRKSASNDS